MDVHQHSLKKKNYHVISNLTSLCAESSFIISGGMFMTKHRHQNLLDAQVPTFILFIKESTCVDLIAADQM